MSYLKQLSIIVKLKKKYGKDFRIYAAGKFCFC